MNVSIYNVHHETDKWTVIRKIAGILHSDDFAPVIDGGRPVNFAVELFSSDPGSLRINGRGTLTLPDEAIGKKFLAYVNGLKGKEAVEKLTIGNRKLRFGSSNAQLRKDLTFRVSRTPYIDPDIEEEYLSKVAQLKDDVKFKLRVDTVQFGIFYRQKYPGPRAFSVEWHHKYGGDSNEYADLKFKYDHKLIRVKLGSGLKDHELKGRFILISFSSIRKIALGYDYGKPYICFDTITPPVLEERPFHRSHTGKHHIDNRKYKQRIGAIDDAHTIVAPYTPHLRILLYHDVSKEDPLSVFRQACKIAGLADSMIIDLTPPGAERVETFENRFFERQQMNLLRKEFIEFDWPIAFQLESLLHNGLIHTGDMKGLIPRIRSREESPIRCFERVQKNFKFSAPRTPRNAFSCYHVTFTPTRMILEGPYPSDSNSIIRRYQNFEEHFIRVDFRDEDRLRYRWIGRKRVGNTLKQGFELAGRKFEFLAYSNSALKEHAVWFVNPFDDPEKGCVNAASIRASIGNFAGTKLLKQPSKYAARLAQAFTATESMNGREVPDLGKDPYLFTDGVGTISKSLADRIWDKLCKAGRSPGTLKPSAYQIRFLGYKGVVAIDEQLDKNENGIHMRLRPSMKKFEVLDDEEAPLVMLLENLGVRKEAFEALQNDAVANAKLIDQSITKFLDLISVHHLGESYKLGHVLTQLRDQYNMELRSSHNDDTRAMDNPFWRQLRQVAMRHVLRDIRHRARIPIHDSYQLVGVADEGPAYQAAGYENVFTLNEGYIFVCIQKPNEEPRWIEGNVSISRSPVTHPGDIQRVHAIGKPPEGMLCLFSHLRNVVVMPSTGSRSLASCLAGGDVDGDLFAVIDHGPILPRTMHEPASYQGLHTWELQDRDSTVDDICDFVVEYINTDILGLLSDTLLVIADKICLKLAELCSHAVDYPKQGTPPNFEPDQIPHTLIRYKPDWHAAEVVSRRKSDYYKSTTALGVLYRASELQVLDDDSLPILEKGMQGCEPLSDPISINLLGRVKEFLGDSAIVDVNNHSSAKPVAEIFSRYVDELRYICATHTLSDSSGGRLSEVEVVMGTILAKCTQHRWRSERIHRMGHHARELVQDVQYSLCKNIEKASYLEASQGLELAWVAWNFSLAKGDDFGAQSFSLIALGVIFECLIQLSK
ncbi:RNA dependent RNA polymerase-domain-containing protein [Gymnopilus junonius]|uniref:RNA-dependent RNA polymerase n=1 Tax=Gymnopilus junonius TaxID=109634 RepID=A0A9P5P110_GYMJU|nr:RNA dependent RNA polymerase-domain-containing protein [Gymnopilus junonius]